MPAVAFADFVNGDDVRMIERRNGSGFAGEVESRLEGNLDLRGFLGLSDEVRNGYEEIRVTFRIKADAPPETLQELCELAQQRSPVFDIITRPTPVTVQLEGAGTMKKSRAIGEMMD